MQNALVLQCFGMVRRCRFALQAYKNRCFGYAKTMQNTINYNTIEYLVFYDGVIHFASRVSHYQLGKSWNRSIVKHNALAPREGCSIHWM